jgi:hypothetical protein
LALAPGYHPLRHSNPEKESEVLILLSNDNERLILYD